FKDGKFQILLHATNSLLHKTAVQGITITEVFENNSEKFKDKAEELFKSQPRTVANPHGQPKIARIIIGILLLILAVYFLLKSFN
ncbi:molecular chaperone DnaJ, partial [Chryseobacterium sp. HMWF001]